MKTTSHGRRPQNIKGGTSQFRGKLRGNLECGSAQPSLFTFSFGVEHLFQHFSEFLTSIYKTIAPPLIAQTNSSARMIKFWFPYCKIGYQ